MLLIFFEELTEELKNFDIKYIGTGPDIMPSSHSKVLHNFDPSEVGVVLVGWDSHLSVPKMWKSTRYLQDKNVHLVATNPDDQYLGADGIPTPGRNFCNDNYFVIFILLDFLYCRSWEFHEVHRGMLKQKSHCCGKTFYICCQINE